MGMNTKILIIDHNDSFTYNLVQLAKEAGSPSVIVNKFDAIEDTIVEDMQGIILSPGPGLPKDYAETFALLRKYKTVKPFLGVCLGLQIIVEYFGGELFNLPSVKHGCQVELKSCKDQPLFKNVTFPMKVGLYHSWAMDKNKKNENLQITSELENGIVMSIRHPSLNIRAVQFHPESFMTDQGFILMKNWLELIATK